MHACMLVCCMLYVVCTCFLVVVVSFQVHEARRSNTHVRPATIRTPYLLCTSQPCIWTLCFLVYSFLFFFLRCAHLPNAYVCTSWATFSTSKTKWAPAFWEIRLVLKADRRTRLLPQSSYMQGAAAGRRVRELERK